MTTTESPDGPGNTRRSGKLVTLHLDGPPRQGGVRPAGPPADAESASKPLGGRQCPPAPEGWPERLASLLQRAAYDRGVQEHAEWERQVQSRPYRGGPETDLDVPAALALLREAVAADLGEDILAFADWRAERLDATSNGHLVRFNLPGARGAVEVRYSARWTAPEGGRPARLDGWKRDSVSSHSRKVFRVSGVARTRHTDSFAEALLLAMEIE